MVVLPQWTCLCQWGSQCHSIYYRSLWSDSGDANPLLTDCPSTCFWSLHQFWSELFMPYLEEWTYPFLPVLIKFVFIKNLQSIDQYQFKINKMTQQQHQWWKYMPVLVCGPGMQKLSLTYFKHKVGQIHPIITKHKLEPLDWWFPKVRSENHKP